MAKIIEVVANITAYELFDQEFKDTIRHKVEEVIDILLEEEGRKKGGDIGVCSFVAIAEHEE